jgi:hypothetical protein
LFFEVAMTSLHRATCCVVAGTALVYVTTLHALAQDQGPLPEAFATITNPSERQTIETAISARTDFETISIRLCGVRRLSLANGEQTLFVVGMMTNGRDYCDTVDIIRAVPKPEVIQTFHPRGEPIDQLVRDLDNDGNPELVFTAVVRDYGPDCRVQIPVVYKCTAAGCSDQSGHFPDFLLQELDKRRYAIAAMTSAGDSNTSCVTMERDKILRLLGRDKVAGLAQAQQWAKSTDREMRDKALEVARDIDDPSATQLLEKLQKDDDKNVSERAARALRARKR